MFHEFLINFAKYFSLLLNLLLTKQLYQHVHNLETASFPEKFDVSSLN